MLDNIPQELRELPQWLVWRYEDNGGEKPTKVPYSPRHKRHASSTNAADWTTFQEAAALWAAEPQTYNGIGFVFTANDPYAVIDLDDARILPDGSPNPNYPATLERQQRIYHEFDCYSELSPSGAGMHIICKGQIPSGRKRNHIEIYSSGRYITFTGNVYNARPIADRQTLLTLLFNAMGGVNATAIYAGDAEQRFTDEEVINRASKAVNGDKFLELLNGNWRNQYPSQSEADFAFVDIIAFYTQHRPQIARIFRASELGKRDKAQREDYVKYMIDKSFDRMVPPVDIEGYRNTIEEVLAQANATPQPAAQLTMFPAAPPAKPNEPPPHVGTLPPGLMGDIAKFVYAQAPRPVPEMALVAAIGLMAGICGRAWNIRGSGLNLYVLFLAPTGTGKEAIAHGISKLIDSIRVQVPAATSFIGPSEIASAQALNKQLGKRVPCFVSLMGEFGLRLQTICSPRANGTEIGLRRILTDLYHKSGDGAALGSMAYSDADKNVNEVKSPAFSMIGESVPEEFYAALDETLIGAGLLPRFLTIEYNGDRVDINDAHEFATPSFDLIERLATLAAQAHSIMHNQRIIRVQTDHDATLYHRDFDRYCTAQINATKANVPRHLWNRADIKSKRLAALVAVGCNMIEPIITVDMAQWAVALVTADIHNLLGRFSRGEVGRSSEESRQTNELLRVIREYVTEPYPIVATYGVDTRLHNDRVIPWTYISRRLMAMAAFRTDRIGSTNAIKRTMQSLIDGGLIREIGRNDMIVKYGYSGRAFVVSSASVVSTMH